jgi:hypothetical protein
MISNQAGYARWQGNRRDNAMANQALYQNYANAAADLRFNSAHGNMYGPSAFGAQAYSMGNIGGHFSVGGGFRF